MKILCVSDTLMPPLQNAVNLQRRYRDIDVVVSCGDLPAHYLDYIVTLLGKPLLYVRGNHDESYADTPPGGINLHETVYTYEGITFAGLEGSLRYNRGRIQYTQGQMWRSVWRFAPKLFRHWLWTRHRVDFFVTHAPAAGIHDGEDYPHHGFNAFLQFMRWYRPRYMIHGHVHTWDRRTVTDSIYHQTRVLNINPYLVLEVFPQGSPEYHADIQAEAAGTTTTDAASEGVRPGQSAPSITAGAARGHVTVVEPGVK